VHQYRHQSLIRKNRVSAFALRVYLSSPWPWTYRSWLVTLGTPLSSHADVPQQAGLELKAHDISMDGFATNGEKRLLLQIFSRSPLFLLTTLDIYNTLCDIVKKIREAEMAISFRVRGSRASPKKKRFLLLRFTMQSSESNAV
jgi:hypothetical protein